MASAPTYRSETHRRFGEVGGGGYGAGGRGQGDALEAAVGGKLDGVLREQAAEFVADSALDWFASLVLRGAPG